MSVLEHHVLWIGRRFFWGGDWDRNCLGAISLLDFGFCDSYFLQRRDWEQLNHAIWVLGLGLESWVLEMGLGSWDWDFWY
jgi:hypothetical protein